MFGDVPPPFFPSYLHICTEKSPVGCVYKPQRADGAWRNRLPRLLLALLINLDTSVRSDLGFTLQNHRPPSPPPKPWNQVFQAAPLTS